LAERISYDQLYQDAVRDPTLKRTKQELEVAPENAKLARNVVFQLFQDLDSFNLEDYRKFDDGGAGMNRLLAFVRDAAQARGAEMRQAEDGIYIRPHALGGLEGAAQAREVVEGLEAHRRPDGRGLLVPDDGDGAPGGGGRREASEEQGGEGRHHGHEAIHVRRRARGAPREAW
jgi:hypothetical protein